MAMEAWMAWKSDGGLCMGGRMAQRSCGVGRWRYSCASLVALVKFSESFAGDGMWAYLQIPYVKCFNGRVGMDDMEE